MTWFVLLLGLLLCPCEGYKKTEDISIRPLQDGLLVYNRTTVWYWLGDWTVIVKMDKPQIDSRIEEFAYELLHHVNGSGAFVKSEENNWNERIRFCMTKIQQMQNDVIVSEPERRLFETLNEEELQIYNDAVNDISKSQNAILHLDNMSVTRNIPGQNQNNHVTLLKMYLDKVRQSVNDLGLKNNKHEMKMDIDQSVQFLEYAVDNFSHISKKYEDYLQLLETPSLYQSLSVEDLQALLQKARTNGFKSQPPLWYYDNVQVKPLWAESNTIVFTAKLPLHDGEPYFLYDLRSWQYPVKPNFNAQLNVLPQLATSTISGYSFIPQVEHCTGHVCKGGPLWRKKYQCEQFMITGKSALRKFCSINISHSKQAIVEEVKPGLYMLSTHGSQYVLYCEGQMFKRIPIAAGVYLITLNHKCKLTGEGRTIISYNPLFTAYSFKLISSSFGLKQIFKDSTESQLALVADDPTKWYTMPEIEEATILTPLGRFTYFSNELLPWINFVAIVMILIGILSLLLCYCWRLQEKSSFKTDKLMVETPMLPGAEQPIQVTKWWSIKPKTILFNVYQGLLHPKVQGRGEMN